ncbi:MAG: ATP-binding cassette domain-containing protein [Acidobacteriia bacterium]|nr:ATP-binding cassette domain-containing protein [Terriglobia bacterium]
MNAQPVIEARSLYRSYGRWRKKVNAVRNISFEVGRGEIFGLIGPDGAGKTSVIQILAGVLRAQRGVAFVGGSDVLSHPEAVKTLIGYMPQGLGANLYESLTVEENIEFFRDLRKLPDEAFQKNRAELLKMTRLGPFLQRRAKNLSGGMRQKLALICTLIHLPNVILLDEPTTGVDPISRQDFWEIIRRIVEERQVTVLLSTSYMDEAERCHRIALIHAGEIIAQGTPESIVGQASGQYATIRADPQPAALNALRGIKEVLSTQVFGEEIHIRYEGNLEEIEKELMRQATFVRQSSPQAPTLEDVFLQLVSDTARRSPSLHFATAHRRDSDFPIECRGVVRSFGDFVAVDNIDLRVRRGEIFGLLGPNGAGKTTLIKMMCGLLEPSAGTILVAGFEVPKDKDRATAQIGYMSQHFSLYRDLTVRQNLRLYSDLYDVESAKFSHLIDPLGLREFESRLAGDLPVGVRQRLSLLCAVLHAPAVLFLDEPTSGVDPQARRTFWELIYSLSRESGITVLVSTHYMDEANHCDRLGLMDQGRLIAAASPSALKSESERRSGRLLAIYGSPLRMALDALHTGFPSATLYGDVIHLRTLDPQFDEQKVLALLNRAGIREPRVHRVPLSMDDTFIDFIQTAGASHA